MLRGFVFKLRQMLHFPEIWHTSEYLKHKVHNIIDKVGPMGNHCPAYIEKAEAIMQQIVTIADGLTALNEVQDVQCVD